MKKLSNEQLFKLRFNPFTIDELTKESIDLFVNRDPELEELLIFINNFSTSAIAGEQGVGKSSLLIKLKSMLSGNNYLVKYLKITPTKDGATLKSSFLRKLLRNLMILISDEKINLSNFGIDLSLEFDRLDYSISFQALQSRVSSTSANVDVGKSESLWDTVIPLSIRSKILKGQSKTSGTSISRSPILHNDDTMKEIIQKIAIALMESGYKVVLLVDELDKLGRKDYAHTHWFQEIYDLLGYCEDIIATGNLLFVFALQKEFFEKYHETLQNPDGDIHFLGLIQEIVFLDNFNFEDALSLIEKRIEFAEGKRKSKDIFELGVLVILFIFAFRNTRKFIQFVNHLLTEATILQSKVVTFDILWRTLIRKHRHTWLTSSIQKFLFNLAKNNITFEKEQVIPDELLVLEQKGYVKRIALEPITFTLNL